jgi:hypothetical protein
MMQTMIQTDESVLLISDDWPSSCVVTVRKRLHDCTFPTLAAVDFFDDIQRSLLLRATRPAPAMYRMRSAGCRLYMRMPSRDADRNAHSRRRNPASKRGKKRKDRDGKC